MLKYLQVNSNETRCQESTVWEQRSSRKKKEVICQAYKLSRGESTFNPQGLDEVDNSNISSKNCRDFYTEHALNDNGQPLQIDGNLSKNPIDLKAKVTEYDYILPKSSKEEVLKQIRGYNIGKINLCKFHAKILLGKTENENVIEYLDAKI